MTSDQLTTSADVITLHHQYSGLIATGGRRLADILSDPNLRTVEMHQTLVHSEGARSMEVRCNQILLVKKDILMVIPTGSHEAPTRRLNNYQKKHTCGVLIVLAGHVLSGIVHLPLRANPWMLLDDSVLSCFFGLTNVTVHSSIHGLVPEHCDTVIVNRQGIESVQLATKPLPAPDSEQAVGTR